MRKIVYAGGSFYTGDALAAAFFDYAAAAARCGTTTAVEIPARTASGARGTVSVLLGPAAQLVSEPVEGDDLRDVIDEDVCARIKGLTAQLLSLQRPFDPPSFD